MGLNKFDKARNNCIKLRNQIVKKKNDFESILTKINIELIKKDLESIKKELETTNNEKDYLKQEIETSELKEKEIIAKYSELREKFDSINKNLERKRILEEELNEIKNKLFSIPLEKNKEETLKEIDDIKLQLNLNKELLEKNEREKDEINSKLLEIEKSNFSIESRLNELIKKIESIENVKKKILEHNIKDLGLELNEIKKQRKEIEKIFNSINIEISNQREHLIELERAGSLCPVCEKELSENNKTKLVLSKKRIVAEKLQEQFNVKENLSEIEKREETLENIFKENRESLDEISNEEEYKTEFNELKTKKQENNILKEQINSSVKQLLEKINYMKNKNEELNNKKEILSSTIHLIELKSKKEKSENSLLEINFFLEKNKDVITEIKNVENEKNEIIKKIQESKTKIQTIDNLIFEKQRAVSNLTREKELYNSQTQEIENLENKSKFLENLKNAIEITQKSLRDELILAVNEMMDSLWSQIYPYDKWQGIKLNVEEGDYILQIKDMQGNWSKVAGFASGGERMLASLAVRIAFSRVLAPGLGLLILDEPTHNLDDKAVETLVEIIKTKLSDLINQVFIVTHDERLAEAGDNVIRL